MWDQLKDLESAPVPRLDALANLAASLLARRALPLAALKVVRRAGGGGRAGEGLGVWLGRRVPWFCVGGRKRGAPFKRQNPRPKAGAAGR